MSAPPTMQRVEEYYDDDYDDEGDDNTYDDVPRQAAGGRLPPNVMAALQHLGGPPAQDNYAVSAQLQALMRQQQEFQRGLQERLVPLLQLQQRSPRDAQEYGEHEHLNRTPTDDDDEEATDDDDDDEEYEEDDVVPNTPSHSSAGHLLSVQAEPVAAIADRHQLLFQQAGSNNNTAADADDRAQEGQLADMSAEDYEPTEQEILEYCEWLGMDPQQEKCLMWIAREALKAPLPENWKMCYTDEREIYYFNVRTGESIWDHPMDAFYKSLFKEEKVKLDQKRKRMRRYPGCLEIRPLAEFFSDLSETCGVGAIDLPVDVEDEGLPPPPWTEVPEALVDPIDFRVFQDPVVLPTSGRTVSRHTIINNAWRDPFTREYCENRRLVHNVDKRLEVDRWLQQVGCAYVSRMRGGRISGIKRLALIVPFLLDRDEEASVRVQNTVLSWLKSQVAADSLYRAAVAEHERAVAAAAAAAASCVAPSTSSGKPSPAPSPRDHPSGRKASDSVTTRASNSVKLSQQKQQPQAGTVKKLQSALQQSRGSVTTQAPLPKHAAVVDVPTPPPKRELLPDLLLMLSEEERDGLLQALLTMSTSASREALLLAATVVPDLLHLPAFRFFNEDICFVLRVSKKDLWDIAVCVNDAEQKETERRLEEEQTAALDDYSRRRGFLSIPALSAQNAGGPATPTRGPSSATQSFEDATGSIEADPTLQDLLRWHRITDSERLLSLGWVLQLLPLALRGPVLPNGDSNVNRSCIVHPVSQLDLVSALHIVLACCASAPALGESACQVKPSTLLQLMTLADGWPTKLAGIKDRHLRAMMEIAAGCVDDAETQIRVLFDLTLHGSERCLDVLRRHGDVVKENVLKLLKTGPAVPAPVIAAPADLMAAVLVFHELTTLQDFVSGGCSPRAVLKVAYNLTPRLARSQWRPKHFHNTVTSFIELVEQHPLEAWSVVDRVGLTFFLRELSKKKAASSDIRSKIEALEYTDKQLEHTVTITRWSLFALRVAQRRDAEIARTIDLQAQKRAQHGLSVSTVALARRLSLSVWSAPVSSIGGATPLQAALSTDDMGSQITCCTPASSVSSLKPTDCGGSVTLPAAVKAVEHKFEELTRQRASLISKALMLLIHVRLKAKQQHHRTGSGSTSGAAPVASSMLDSPSAVGGGKHSGHSTTSSFLTSPNSKPPLSVGGVSPSSRLSPRQADLVTAPPPPAPLSLPSLRAPRGPQLLVSSVGDATSRQNPEPTGFLPPI